MDQLLKLMAEQSYVDITLSELRDAVRLLEGEDFLTVGGEIRNPSIMRKTIG